MKKIIGPAAIVIMAASATLLLFSFNDKKDRQSGQYPREIADRDYTEKLTPDNCALVMVDFLTGFDPGLSTIPRAEYNHNTRALAKMSGIFKLPTIVLGEEGGFRGKFYPLVQEFLKGPNYVRVERHTPSAWDEPKFREELKKTGRKKVILGGISLDICTQLLALDLLRAGYDVYVVTDCSGTDQPIVEISAMMRMTQAGAVMVTWGTLASEIMKDWQSPYGAAIGKLYMEESNWGAYRGYMESAP